MLLESCANAIVVSYDLLLAHQGTIISHYEGSVTSHYSLFYFAPNWLIFESHVKTVQLSKYDTKVPASSSSYMMKET